MTSPRTRPQVGNLRPTEVMLRERDTASSTYPPTCHPFSTPRGVIRGFPSPSFWFLHFLFSLFLPPSPSTLDLSPKHWVSFRWCGHVKQLGHLMPAVCEVWGRCIKLPVLPCSFISYFCLSSPPVITFLLPQLGIVTVVKSSDLLFCEKGILLRVLLCSCTL